MTFKIGQLLIHKPTGDKLIVRELYAANQYHGAGVRGSPPNNSCMTRGYALDELEPAPERNHRNGYDLNEEMIPRMQGVVPWEHIERADLKHVIGNVACCAGWTVWPGIGNIKTPGSNSRWGTWCRYFLPTLQGGGLTGEAYAIAWENAYTKEWDQAAAAEVVERAVAHVTDPKSPPGDLGAAVEAMTAIGKKQTSVWPSAWKVAICKHDVKEGAGANHMRGWHPAYCAKCDINLSVDSSD